MSEPQVVPERPTFESIHLELARLLAERSRFRRLHVGTAITIEVVCAR